MWRNLRIRTEGTPDRIDPRTPDLRRHKVYKDRNRVGPALILRLRQNQAPGPARARITNLLSRKGGKQHRALVAMDSRRASSVGSGVSRQDPRGHGQVGTCSHARAGDGGRLGTVGAQAPPPGSTAGRPPRRRGRPHRPQEPADASACTTKTFRTTSMSQSSALCQQPQPDHPPLEEAGRHLWGGVAAVDPTTHPRRGAPRARACARCDGSLPGGRCCGWRLTRDASGSPSSRPYGEAPARWPGRRRPSSCPPRACGTR